MDDPVGIPRIGGAYILPCPVMTPEGVGTGGCERGEEGFPFSCVGMDQRFPAGFQFPEMAVGWLHLKGKSLF
jgi:hypothetical protein